MNLRSENREWEGNSLGLMNQFQKNPFTRSPSISTRVRRWEMLTLTLSTSELWLSTLWVRSKKTDSGTETRKPWLGKSARQKSRTPLPPLCEILRWLTSCEIAVGQELGPNASVLFTKTHCWVPWVVSSSSWLQQYCPLATQPFQSVRKEWWTESSAHLIAMAWGIVEDSLEVTGSQYRGKAGQELSTDFGVSWIWVWIHLWAVCPEQAI